MSEPLRRLLATGPIAIALGVREFAEALREQGASVVEVSWRPPADVDQKTRDLLDKLL